MRRLAGFVLLQLASALFALRRVTDSRRRTEALRSFCDMLDQLRGLLESDGSPMPALLQTLSGRCGGEAGAFIGMLNASMGSLGRSSFDALWKKALSACALSIDTDTKRELEALGGVLGRYDMATELDALDTCRRHLRTLLDAHLNAQSQDTRMTIGLSLSASLLLGILLI